MGLIVSISIDDSAAEGGGADVFGSQALSYFFSVESVDPIDNDSIVVNQAE